MVVFVIAGSDVKGGSKLALRGELHISSEAQWQFFELIQQRCLPRKNSVWT
jgi:hypothetical protein